MSKTLSELVVKECKASEFADCDIVFSGLNAEDAESIGTLGWTGHEFQQDSASDAISRNGVSPSQHCRLLQRKELPKEPPCASRRTNR